MTRRKPGVTSILDRFVQVVGTEKIGSWEEIIPHLEDKFGPEWGLTNDPEEPGDRVGYAFQWLDMQRADRDYWPGRDDQYVIEDLRYYLNETLNRCIQGGKLPSGTRKEQDAIKELRAEVEKAIVKYSSRLAESRNRKRYHKGWQDLLADSGLPYDDASPVKPGVPRFIKRFMSWIWIIATDAGVQPLELLATVILAAVKAAPNEKPRFALVHSLREFVRRQKIDAEEVLSEVRKYEREWINSHFEYP